MTSTDLVLMTDSRSSSLKCAGETSAVMLDILQALDGAWRKTLLSKLLSCGFYSFLSASISKFLSVNFISAVVESLSYSLTCKIVSIRKLFHYLLIFFIHQRFFFLQTVLFTLANDSTLHYSIYFIKWPSHQKLNNSRMEDWEWLTSNLSIIFEWDMRNSVSFSGSKLNFSTRELCITFNTSIPYSSKHITVLLYTQYSWSVFNS